MTRLTRCLILAVGTTAFLTSCQAQQGEPAAAEAPAAATPNTGASPPMSDVVKNLVDYLHQTNQPMTPALQSWIHEMNAVVQQQHQAVQQGNNDVRSAAVVPASPPSNALNADTQVHVVPVNPHIVNNAQPLPAEPVPAANPPAEQPAPAENPPAANPPAAAAAPAQTPQIANNAITPVQTIPAAQTPQAQPPATQPPTPATPATTGAVPPIVTPVQTATPTGSVVPTPVESVMTSMMTTRPSVSMTTSSAIRSVTTSATPSASFTSISGAAALIGPNELFNRGGSYSALVATVMLATMVVFLA